MNFNPKLNLLERPVRSVLYFVLCIVFCFSCLISCTYDKINYPLKSEISGLATPIIFENGKTNINLNDYFDYVTRIDSVSFSAGTNLNPNFNNQRTANYCKLTLSSDKKTLTINYDTTGRSKSSTALPFFNLKIWEKGFPYSIPAKKSMKITRKFMFNPHDKKYKSVELSGDFNGWTPSNNKLVLKDKLWETDVTLNPGRYSYQIVADNKWFIDPDNPNKVDNNLGGYNSVFNFENDESDKIPVLYTVNSKIRKIIIGFENNPDEIFVYWQNYMLSDNMITRHDNQVEIKLPYDATKYNRSYVRVWSCNKYGVSNDLLIPLWNGRIIKNATDLNRHDMQDMILYFIMVDRFYDGNKSNDKPVKDPKVSPKANYYGGDIAGITDKVVNNYFTDWV